MRKSLPLLLVILFAGNLLSGQKQAERWYFGQYAGISFNNDTVVAVTNGQLSTPEGCSSIADANGQPLFYTDGIYVYNRNDSLMPNGSDLDGDISSTQSALIVPYPGNSNLYYIFTADADGGPFGFRYSMVDLTLEGGLGDVTSKNVPLLSQSTEKISGVGSADGGFWVMAHEWPGDGFYEYKITTAGLNTTPTVIHIGTVHNDSVIQNTYGQMKFSPDGQKLALGIGYQGIFELFNFDNATGALSHPVTMPGSENVYGLEFSADNSKMYTTRYNHFYDMFYLDQYDLSSGIDSVIIASRTPVNPFGNSDQMRQLQLGPDHKIYMAKGFEPFLAVIDSPDLLAPACNFVDNSLYLDPNNGGLIQSTIGLPGFVQSFFREGLRAAFDNIDTSICPGTCINFTDVSRNGPVTSWEWHFPLANPDTSTQQNPHNICYPNSGSYAVTLIVGNGLGFDTVRMDHAVNVFPLPSISITVLGDTMRVFNGVAYQWYRDAQPISGATNNIFIADTAGSYSVLLTDSNGCTALSNPVVVSGISEPEMDAVRVYPNPMEAGAWNLEVATGLIGSKFEIYDNNGRVILRSQIRNRKSLIELNVERGIYLMRILSANNAITRKLIHL